MPAIFRIRTEFESLWDEARRLLPVRITSADPARLGHGAVRSAGGSAQQVDRQVEVSSRR